MQTIKLYIKKATILSLLLLCTMQIASVTKEELFNQGSNHYNEGNFSDAVNSWEEILNQGVESWELYYNIGNAYYRKGELPSAILNYERALLRAPQNSDIKYNLDLAYEQTIDDIESVTSFFMSRWFNNLKNIANSNSWAIISISTFTLALIALLFYFFSKTSLLRKISFSLALFTLLLSLIAFNYSNKQMDRLTAQNRAIIFTPSVTIQSAPGAAGSELFILHEGTKVEVLQKVDNWYQIQIKDGNRGWIKESDIEII
ncbi:tetratricopeptide repeat protein [Marinilabiliaceae bacterium ANBcel2]|nr:tetratricopeptide repeat protein [Marinilabiliaceae bacterium ANBcel2]